MSAGIEWEPYGEGVRITNISSLEHDVEIPSSIDGMDVVALGSRCTMGVHGTPTHVIKVPGTVTEMDADAFSGTSGIIRVEYGGDISVFSGFMVSLVNECTLACTHEGIPYEFTFPRGHTMSFPAFDDEMIEDYVGLDEETAMTRLSEPVMLTERNESRYRAYLRGRIIPRAEHAVVTGDVDDIVRIESTGMLDDEDLRNLLRRSVTSGKPAMTSALMSVIRSRSVRD